MDTSNSTLGSWRSLLCAATLALTVSACGGGGDTPPPPPATIVGAAGGTVTGPNGAQVVIPAGALAANTAIAVTLVAPVAALPAGNATVGPVYAFTPHGQTFAQPVTITVPVDPAQVPAGTAVKLYKTMNGAAGPWQEVAGATRTGNLISGQVTSFSDVVPTIAMGTPIDRAVVAPASATFTVNAVGGTPPYTYQWEKSDAGGAFVPAPGATNSATYTTGPTSMTADNGDRYQVKVTSADTDGNGILDGSATSRVATLTVTVVVDAPAITTQPASQSVATGSNVSFSVVATGTDLVYQWQKNGASIAGQTNASLNLGNVQAGDAGSYTVVVSNLVNGTIVNSLTSNAASLTVTAPPPASGAARIAAGSDFSLARRANGDLYSWGSDSAGTLGAGNGDQSRNVPGLVATNNIANLAAGSAHGLAVRGTGEVRGWGYNGFGQLGDGTFTTREAPTSATVDPAGVTQYSDAVAVCGGDLHSLVLRSGGTVHAMGYNAEGQLGDGSNSDIGRPRGLAVPGIGSAVAIACGQRSSLALLANGTVLAWGRNNAGQLGDGTSVNRNTPTPVAGLTNVIAIAAGTEHSLALRSDGSVWAWGSNVNGKLGDGSTVNRLTPTATLLTAGITAIAAGSTNSLALRNDGAVLAWGINETGQLGSGSLSPGFRPQPAPVINLSNVVAISFGSGALGHGLAVLADGTVWAWGDNQMGTNSGGSPVYGRLGNGSTVPFSATPVQVTGLNLN